jgi:hypothetical protein
MTSKVCLLTSKIGGDPVRWKAKSLQQVEMTDVIFDLFRKLYQGLHSNFYISGLAGQIRPGRKIHIWGKSQWVNS